ncbi:CpaF family protein [Pelagibius sp.]|uniref:CpaF family protein n=1 Tax=Pelagibius sp. TaxID=1931238 RepID=UPI002622E4C9|nr:CpaF family protein [Pelagibius sp.]
MTGVADSDQTAKPGAEEIEDANLDAVRRQLQPAVLGLFGDDDISMIPRPELALRIGNLLTNEVERSGTKLTLLQRRKLVTGLIDWLLQCEALQPEERQEIIGTIPEAQSGAVTPPEGHPKDKATTHTPTIEAARNKVHPLVMDRLDVSAASQLPRDDLTRQIGEIVREITIDEKLNLNAPEQQSIVDLMLDDMLGLGPLEPLLADESVTDIMVNGPYQIYVERRGKLELSGVRFQNDEHVLNIARRIVSQIGRRVDETTPLVDARLLDGSRVNIIIPPLAIDGPSISIRKFAKKGITLDVMQNQNNISPAMGTVLKIASRSQLNILISGGTGSGKTTLLNAMSQMIDPGERIVTIEDAAELQLQQPHVVRLETRPPNLEGSGEITMRDLVKNALRMRPDRIILGEVRGSEAVDMLQAMNTGHDGSLGTIHANRPREALTRLENMIGMAGINLPARAVRTQIASALDMIVQVSRMRDGMRRVTHVEEIVGMEGEIITTQTLFTYEFEGEGKDGLLLGSFKSSGLRPHFTPRAAYFGLDKPLMEVMG